MVKPICHLGHVGRTLCHSLFLCLRSSAGQHLHTGMSFEPLGLKSLLHEASEELEERSNLNSWLITDQSNEEEFRDRKILLRFADRLTAQMNAVLDFWRIVYTRLV